MFRLASREFGPVRIGDVAFSSRKGDGTFRAGAKVKLDGTGQVWRVLYASADGRLRLRSGKSVLMARPSVEPVVVPFRIEIYSIEGQAFRVTASSVAEPPLLQSTWRPTSKRALICGEFARLWDFGRMN